MYFKCCVANCNSKRQDVKLHKFPSDEVQRNKWKEVINFNEQKSLDTIEVGKLLVCHRHFEPRFYTKKSGVRKIAYPTLFSSEEIETGFPSSSYVDQENKANDHTYVRKRHFDHSYCKQQSDTTVVASTTVPYTCKTNQACAPDTADKPQPTQEVYEIDDSGITISEDNNEIIKACEDDDIETTIAEDDFVLIKNCEAELATYDVGDDDVFNADPLADAELFDEAHRWFKCNVCLGEISGFRYVCVQCSDYDMCARCETRGEHPHHYALRVPSKAHNSESRAVLHSLRRFFGDLHPAAGLTPSHPLTADIKEEIVEVKDEEEVNLVELEPNPLGDDSLEEHMLEDNAIENYAIDDNAIEDNATEDYVIDIARDSVLDARHIVEELFRELPSVAKRTLPLGTQRYSPAKKMKHTNREQTYLSLESEKHFKRRSLPLPVEKVISKGRCTEAKVVPQKASVTLIQLPLKMLRSRTAVERI